MGASGVTGSGAVTKMSWLPKRWSTWAVRLALGGLGQVDWSVVVAVVAVRMVQATLDQIVDVIPVGNRFVTAAGTVDMSRFVA